MKALVLSGGGARGAYQVGVLKAVGELARDNNLENPFQILCGVSAGAINASFLASECHQFSKGTEKLVDLWASLKSERVFKTDILSMSRIGLQWMGELSFGGFGTTTEGRALLDTEPLLQLIRDNLNLPQIQENIHNRKLSALAITALDYQTSESITFVQANDHAPSWKKTRRRSEKTMIQPEHVLASSSIPILFPATPVGSRHFGDGCVRNLSPLGPALYLGASELLVIGVRLQKEISATPHTSLQKPPSVARVANLLLNAVLLDGIEIDFERLQRINEFLRRVPPQHQTNLNFKPVHALFISPSEDIGKIAAQMASRLPRVIRYLLKGLGPLEEASEIISYLLFEKDFTLRLIEMGYQDGMNQKDEILRFLLESRPQSLDWEGF
ncbi:MAG: patatin-like phospholipase family protein [Pseudobdellovibrionaceae bacterium]